MAITPAAEPLTIFPMGSSSFVFARGLLCLYSVLALRSQKCGKQEALIPTRSRYEALLRVRPARFLIFFCSSDIHTVLRIKSRRICTNDNFPNRIESYHAGNDSLEGVVGISLRFWHGIHHYLNFSRTPPQSNLTHHRMSCNYFH